jgi:DNA-binding SARP family transcriptional activator
MPEFNLTLFGGFIISKADGKEIYIANAKERALLAYLALHPGKPLARSHLAGLLWGEQSERRARHSLS